MLRRNFIKKILLFSLAFLSLKTKIMANSLYKPFNMEGGMFLNNYVLHKSSFKDFWKWRKESNKPKPMSFPVVKNNPSYLKSNNSEKTITWVGHSTFLIQIDGVNILTCLLYTYDAADE